MKTACIKCLPKEYFKIRDIAKAYCYACYVGYGPHTKECKETTHKCRVVKGH